MKKIVTQVHKLSSKGVHEKIGNIIIIEHDDCLEFIVNVKGFSQNSFHGFHVHEFGDLSPKRKNGKMVAGLSAGSHFDPYNAGFHGHPEGQGHLGDLPKLKSDEEGRIMQSVRQYRLQDLNQIKNRSLIIHKFGDNYSDNPLPNGGGKSRFAGAIITSSCPYCIKENPMRENRQKPIADPQERFKRWHWGIKPTHQIQVPDDRFPDEMIEIGRLMEIRLNRPIELRENRKNKEIMETMQLEIDEDSINDCYVVFDNNHKKDRIYFLLNPETKKDLKKIYNDLDDKSQYLNDLAIYGGGHHGKMQDYPKVKAKPLGYVSDLVYYTHKKGDDDGIGSGYTHAMGEEGGVQPLLGVSSDGNLWFIGGSYTCPYAGITN